MRIGWGLIGCGRIADKWVAPAIQAVEGSELVAVFSRDPRKAQAFAERHGAKRAYSDLDAFLGDRDLEIVYVATTNNVHAEQTIRCAEAGKHVLCEKPMATSIAEAEQMIAACREAGVRLALNYHMRAFPANGLARRHIVEGGIGRPQVARASLAVLIPEDARAWRLSTELMGGVILDMATHCVNLLRYLLNDEVVEVAAHAGQQMFQQGAEDSALCLLRFSRGTLAFVHAGYNIPFIENGYEIYGTHGTLTGRRLIGQCPGGVLEWRSLDGVQTLAQETVNPYESYVRSFARAVRAGGEVLTSGEEGLQDLKVGFALQRAVQERRTVRLAAPGGVEARG